MTLESSASELGLKQAFIAADKDSGGSISHNEVRQV
jgi:hypothetical protein